MGSTAANAMTKIDEFEKRSSGSDWLVVKKDDLVRGLRDRIKTPDHINTSVVNLCGPGAFFRCMAMDDPVMYVQTVISLFETNKALLGSRVFSASYSLRIATPPSGMDSVDWVPLASLRDAENTLINYDDPDGGLSGLTMPAGLEKWFKEAGYTDVRNVTNLVVCKGQDNLEKADWLCSMSRYRVVLLIDSDMLSTAKQNNRSLYPDHWVTLTAPVVIKGGGCSTKVHSWGQIMPIPEMGTMPINIFLRNYYGYVAAKPS